MILDYKKRHYNEQLARPKKKRCSSKVKYSDNWSFYESLYNQPFRINERLAREQQRKRQENKEVLNRFKIEQKHLFKQLTKFENKMKNQTINTASTLTVENFKSNLIAFLGNESQTLLEQLDWTLFDCTNKETRNTSFKAMLDANKPVATELDSIEESKDKEQRDANKAQAKKMKEFATAIAKAKTDAERLAILAQFNLA